MSSKENEIQADNAPNSLECIFPDMNPNRLAMAYISRALRESPRLDADAWRLVSLVAAELMRSAAGREDKTRAHMSMRLATMLSNALDSWGGDLS